MNLAIVNENVNVINSLTIDIIKVMHGVYDAETLKDELVNFYFSKVIIDITAVKNYYLSSDLLEVLNYFGTDKVILLLNDSEVCNNNKFLAELVKNGYYNFTKNAQAIVFLISKPNTYEDVKKYVENETFTSVLTQSNDTLKKDIVNNTITNTNSINNQIIIGIQNLSENAGATTLMVQMVKQLALNYNVKGIELNGRDNIYFRNDKILTCIDYLEAKDYIKGRFRNINVIIIDLNNFKDKDSLCTDIIYLLEPGIIRLSKFVKNTPNLDEFLENKKIVLNRSALKDEEINYFEKQTGIKVFYNLINFDDRRERLLSVDKLLIKLGFDKQEIK